MGYQGPYSLCVRCISECLSMMVVMFIGKSAIANELLPSCKGHKMGWGFVSFSSGLAFFTGIQMFGQLSAIVNPAFCVSLWISGDIDAVDVLALGAAEIFGAFLGACLMFLVYRPHFGTDVAQPTSKEPNGLTPTAETARTPLLDGTADAEDPPAQPVRADSQADNAVHASIKLSIFATRPAIHDPFWNWVAEFLGTTALLFCVMMFSKRLSYIGAAADPLTGLAVHTFSAFLVGMVIFVCVLALGGPTRFAANPALDMGPRLAHFVLPIPGKGTSEFGYSWIPVTAPYAAGALVGVLYLLVGKMFV